MLILTEMNAGAMTMPRVICYHRVGRQAEVDQSMLPPSMRHELLLVLFWLVVGITLTAAAAIWLGLDFHSLI